VLAAAFPLGGRADRRPGRQRARDLSVHDVVDGQTIVFRTDPGSKLRGLDRIPAVCFEADGINLDDHTGWSVLVTGRAVEVTGAEEKRRAGELP
jgi:hypothetical protein